MGHGKMRGMREWGETRLIASVLGSEGKELITNAQCPMPNAQYPMPNTHFELRITNYELRIILICT
jgi:hypothetical protein